MISLEELIVAIEEKHRDSGIDTNPPAFVSEIEQFERIIGFTLPQDFRDFYQICNGFSCNEDIFNMTPLVEIMYFPGSYGVGWFYFSEYMINSDMWGLRISPKGGYELFNGGFPEKTMTTSLKEFLGRYLTGDVFDTDGLYDWHQELEIK